MLHFYFFLRNDHLPQRPPITGASCSCTEAGQRASFPLWHRRGHFLIPELHVFLAPRHPSPWQPAPSTRRRRAERRLLVKIDSLKENGLWREIAQVPRRREKMRSVVSSWMSGWWNRKATWSLAPRGSLRVTLTGTWHLGRGSYIQPSISV